MTFLDCIQSSTFSQLYFIFTLISLARMLKKAVDGLGTNEVMLYTILCGRSNDDMELLKKTYYKMYTDDLVSRMSGEVGGDMKEILLSTVQVRISS